MLNSKVDAADSAAQAPASSAPGAGSRSSIGAAASTLPGEEAKAMQDGQALGEDYYAEENATFGDRVAAARDRVGLSQGQLARRLGVKAQTVANWESDRAEPRANKLQMLAGVLNVSMVWLMTGEGDGLPAPEEPATTDRALHSLLTELRETRMQQARLAERLARIEKRLRAVVDAQA